MQCYVYRSRKKNNTYLFLPEQDNFNPVPDALKRLFGEAEFSFAFELHPEKQLRLADASEVMRHIREHGFFLQLPPGNEQLFNSTKVH